MPSVTLSVDAVEPAERATLENLAQFYVYDWSEIRRTEFSDVANDGRFPAYPLDPYFREGDRDRDHHAFFIRADGRLAGFALVRKQTFLAGDRVGHDVAEFFVLRAHRRSGIGARAATTIFDRFRGWWEVRQRVENEIATKFWRRVIADYTGGRYDEATFDDARWRGCAQTFDNATTSR